MIVSPTWRRGSAITAPYWCYTGVMSIALSVKNVPGDLARALRQRAERNHRSLQGELLHILEEAVQPRPFRAHELVKRSQALGIKTDADSAAIIRRDRDRR